MIYFWNIKTINNPFFDKSWYPLLGIPYSRKKNRIMLIDVLNCQKVLPSFLPLWNSHTYANLDMARITLNVSFSNLPKCLLMKKCIIFPITVWKIHEFTLTTNFCKNYVKSEYLLVNCTVSCFHELFLFRCEWFFRFSTLCLYGNQNRTRRRSVSAVKWSAEKLVIYFDGIFNAYWRNLFLNFYNHNFSSKWVTF